MKFSFFKKFFDFKDERAIFASERRDFLEAFSLVYQRYLSRGYISPNEKELFYTPYQVLSDSRVGLCFSQKKKILLSTASIVLDSDLGLPSDVIYKKELDILRSKGYKLAEITCLAAKDNNFFQNGLFPLWRLLFLYARLKGVTCLVVSIRPNHRSFYEKMFFFRPAGKIKIYEGVFNVPVILEKLDLVQLDDFRRCTINPFKKELFNFFLKEPSLPELVELTKVKNISSQDFWFFFMDSQKLFVSLPPHFQKFFSLTFDLVLSLKRSEVEKIIENF